MGATLLGLVYWIVVVLGAVFLGARSTLLGWIWLIGAIVVAGWFWHAVLRYFLYLIKAGHIAVLTELITRGKVGHGSESMFAYGKRAVKERFGQVTALFGLDLLVDGIVRAFNRTLVCDLIPVPGLDSITSVVQAVLRASTTYIDEAIFSYNLARGDDNAFRSSKDGLVYYAQDSKAILKTGAFNLLSWVPETIKSPALLVFGAVAIVALCLMLLGGQKKASVPVVALVLFTAGAIGNYLDRVFRGYVVDFVHLQHWPVFNVADVYITVGYFLLAWVVFVNRRRGPAAPQSTA